MMKHEEKFIIAPEVCDGAGDGAGDGENPVAVKISTFTYHK
jgi:hypothetical protein